MTEQDSKNIKLSENFTLWEFLHSNEAVKNNIMYLQFQIDNDKIQNLRNLCINVLQPLRNHYKKKIKINSGYRSVELNNIIGKSKNSEHLYGMAADITCENLNECFEFIKKTCKFNQLIYYRDMNFIHVSYNSVKNKMQIIYK